VDGELWHGTWEGEDADIRQVDPKTGEVLTRLTMPDGAGVSGLESDQGELFCASGGQSGRIRALRKQRRRSGRQKRLAPKGSCWPAVEAGVTITFLKGLINAARSCTKSLD
jgi:hypothetical protein